MAIFSLSACAGTDISLDGASQEEEPPTNEIHGNVKTYYALEDGTWSCDDIVYLYRLEISGRMPNAKADSTFTYLSNIQKITFTQAYLASGLGGDDEVYFDVEDAVLVDMQTVN